MTSINIKLSIMLLSLLMLTTSLYATDPYNFGNSCRTSGSGQTNFRAHVSEVPVVVEVENGNVDLGSIMPGYSIDFTLGDWNNTAVLDIKGARGYKIKITGNLPHTSSPLGGLKINYQYKLQNRTSWENPTSDSWVISNITSNECNSGNLRLLVSVDKLTADPGTHVGERVYKLIVTAEYTE